MDKGNEATASALGPMSLMERQCLVHAGHRLPDCRESAEAHDRLVRRGYVTRGAVPGVVVLTLLGAEAVGEMLAKAGQA